MKKLIAAFAVLAVFGVAKLGQHLYRWQAHSAERTAIAALEVRLEEAGLRVVDSQVRAADLREQLERLDAELEAERNRLIVYETDAADGSIRGGARGYRVALDRFNGKVAERNARFSEWRETLEDNGRFVDRYNALADSIRTQAERMGDPYYPIRSPAEIAVARGWGEEDSRTSPEHELNAQ